ncbi:MAG TPA: roadblock/LC7 domain-containing protein [Polyangia bacterium]|nr:roadblock/LC7 domain-containing protein [Polyangia bacterium]
MSELEQICQRLLRDSNALAILLIDRSGRLVAHAGEALDAQSLSSVTSLAIDHLLAEREYWTPFSHGKGRHLHLLPVGKHAVVAVVFDIRSSLGLVRLRAKKAVDALARCFDRGPGGGSAPPAAALIDDD